MTPQQVCSKEWVPSDKMRPRRTQTWPASPNAENRGGHVHDLKWSNAEKSIASKAFNRALQREFEAIIRTVKETAWWRII
jgi:hypothetical protein